MIPYGKHSVDQADIAAVVEVLENQFLTQGYQVPAFEQALSQQCKARYAVAVNSGTSALHIACLAVGVGPGDIVWTSPLSFVASANCALYCGAEIDFVDIDPVTRNISPELLREKLDAAKRQNRLPKAIIPVHFAGMSCDMRAIREITAPYGIALIEDACHALGGQYQGEPIGSCTYSDACVLSFHPVKSITTAEGGAVLTNSEEVCRRLELFAKHGITRDPAMMEGGTDGPWYYQQIALGFNYRLSDLHAALGISQLGRLEQFISARLSKANHYHSELASLPLGLPVATHDSAWHLYAVELLDQDRTPVFNKLQALGVGVNVHYIPIHLQPFYRQMGFGPGMFPNAEAFYQRALSLPLFPDMTGEQQGEVVSALRQCV